MALTPEEEAELAELEKQVSPEFREASGSVTPAPKNSLGVTGIINQPEAPLSPEDSEVGRIASALDPRFDLIPQGLALLPGTNDPRGDQAAFAGFKAGEGGDVKFAYEPPVAVVRKQLLENPNMLRLLRSDPPSPEDIAAMDSDSPLYKDAANYMWDRTAEAASKGGYTVYRYSQLPWGNEDWSFENLGLKLRGMGQPAVDAATAVVMGVDDLAGLGAGRATMETATPETQMHVPESTDYMGLDEKVPQKTAELNAMNIEEHPLAYAGGQVYGATRGWGAPGLVYKGILEGGGKLAQLVARTRMGALATKAPSLVKGAAGLAGEVAAGTGEALATQAGQEAVDAAAGAAGGREPVLGAGERILDTGENAALWGLGGGVLGRMAGLGANAMRHSDRLGQGAVGRTEKNLDWGPGSVAFGPGLKGDVKGMVRRANIEENAPGDYIAEKIAPPMRERARQNAEVGEARAGAVRADFHRSPEGLEHLPMTQLHERSLERARDHFMPEPNGKLRAVDDKGRPVLKVFNSLVREVSTTPSPGAMKLTPDEAEQFLSSPSRYKLIKDDIEAAGARAKGAPKADIKRDEYLQTIDSRKRKDVEEEIDASIDDLLGDTPTPAARARAEQRVLRERVEEEAFAEREGPLGDYLRQRGIDAVYVTSRPLDARRADTLIKGLGDDDLVKAAKLDRKQRPAGGEKGGYSRMLAQQDEAAAKAKAIEESIAPKGDAFRAVAQHGRKPKLGDKQDADVMRQLADEAGVRPDLDLLRSLQDTLGVQHLSHGRTMTGRTRGLFDPNAWIDRTALRAFPVLRALEPGGDVTGGMMSRMALMGQIEDEKARQGEVERSKPGYEKRRADLQKDKDREREKAKKERARRRTEKHRDE
jgi:hypothetical protein